MYQLHFFSVDSTELRIESGTEVELEQGQSIELVISCVTSDGEVSEGMLYLYK